MKITLPYPLSANRYWRPVRIGKHITIVPTRESKAFRAEVAALAKQAGLQLVAGWVEVTIRVYPSRPVNWAKRAHDDPDGWDASVRCIDMGNAEKVMSDALNGIAWTDDKWIRRLTVERMVPDGLARTEIEVRAA